MSLFPQESGPQLDEGSYSLHQNGWKLVADGEFPREWAEQLISDPEEPLSSNQSVVLKRGNSATVLKIAFVSGETKHEFVYKRMIRKNLVKRLTSVFRENHTFRNWRLGRLLGEKGIPTARPWLVMMPESRFQNRPSYLLTEWMGGASDLDRAIREISVLPEHEQHACLVAAVISIGNLLGHFHATGFCHRDLKAGNLLVDFTKEGVPAYVIDLDGMTTDQSVDQRRWRDLSRLAYDMVNWPILSRSNCLRGLFAYMKASGINKKSWKGGWREIATRVKSRADRTSSSKN
ncbi:lipopolysaccharide kinase InaA family protein [Calycomorphotria hydatis]|uniref:3-deoxy-D-manno-octulosonic-acid kinase n=1 Tax=Calycomorphotria hydatis TaxID=2528027 RepID=A0A517T965_9PLAN|nr:lipopolysaccharide kinase InaA family protein [Calycomorphotria hydatis]QDT64907.1 3-deoxy-D-manno-octulosonic-acid kinase [Calycomorphotria hydatis]